MKKIIFLSLTALFILLPVHAQQNRKVSGKVTDLKTGEELIGVSVTLKGSSKGTITDINGNYSLDIVNPAIDILTFSYIGYEATPESVKSRTIINVKLSDSNKQLSEVVVVGYGSQKKVSVIGSISSINNKTLKSMPISNLSQGLAGKLSGIQVVQSSGEIGSDDASILVRGRGTWGNSSPIYVVDGIIRAEFSKIDPNEVESINVLKDASATAVFGVQGANGVIIVTTKRGTLGKPKISVTAQNAITQLINIPQPLGAYDATSLQYLADWGRYKPRTPTTGSTANDLMLWRTGASPYTHSDVRWVDNVMKKQSSQQQYNINISGGTKTVRYFLSGGFLNQNGFYQHDLSKYSRFNFRSNLDVDVSKNLTASLSVGTRVENLQSTNATIWSSWNIYRAAFAISGRNNPVYNPDGSYGSSGMPGRNLVKILQGEGFYRDVKTTLESSLSLNYKLDFITKGLSAKGQVSFDTQGENGRSWGKSTAEYTYNQTNNSYLIFGEDRPIWYAGVAKNNSWYKFYKEVGLNYNRTFGNHTVTGLFLANQNERINNAEVPYAYQGLVGRATYDYDKRYFAEINIGINGSENFPATKRYGTFPAFAMGWMVSNENFIAKTKLANIITSLKLRASLGWVGNDQIGGSRFLFVPVYSNAGGYPFGTGDNNFGGIQQGAIPNYAAQWEVARKQNIGFDADFFKGLLSVNFDYFYEYRNSILTTIDAIKPDYVGAAFQPANIGEAINQGFELELKHNKRISKDFSYFINANLTYNRSKILKKADPLGLLPYQKEEGYPIGAPNMFTNLGYFTSYEEINSSPSQLAIHGGIPSNVEVIPGDLKFLDFNNDGVINADDAHRQGYSTTPDLQYGLTVGGNWKAFDFSVLLQGSTFALFPKNWEIQWAFSNNDNVFPKHNYYWAPEIANDAQFTRFYGKSWVNNERYYSGYEMGSGTYVRIKNFELGYTLPSSLTKKADISSVRFYLSAVNPYMWSVEKYLDPDNRESRGGLMPPTQAYNIGLNVNF